MRKNDLASAKQLISVLIANNPEQLIFRHTDIEIDVASERLKSAEAKVDTLLQKNPTSYPLLLLKSEIFLKRKKYHQSSELLDFLTKHRPADPDIWYRLAEVNGLAGDIAGVHKARAEYFILVGAFDRARKQLGRAATLLKDDFKESAMIRQRLRDLAEMEDRIVKL